MLLAILVVVAGCGPASVLVDQLTPDHIEVPGNYVQGYIAAIRKPAQSGVAAPPHVAAQ